MIREFLTALQFLTRIPVHLEGAPTGAEQGRSLLWYPIVGLVLGGCLLALCFITTGVPAGLRAALVVVTWVALTGAMHIDGLADTADAWVGGRGDRERTLEIMRDPRCGAMGVTAIALLILVKYSALIALLESRTGDLSPIMIAPVLARVMLPLLFLSTPYARREGAGAAISRNFPRRLATVAILCASAGIAIVGGVVGPWFLAAVLCVFVALRAWTLRRIQGFTGDFAGALVEVSEATVLVTSVLVNRIAPAHTLNAL